MSSMLLLLCVSWIGLAAAFSAPPYALEDIELHFERFIVQYDKQYSSETEKQVRFEIFKENIEVANAMNEMSDHAVFGITKFTDLTKEEFLSSYTGLRTSFHDGNHDFDDGCDLLTDSDIPDADAPESFDWRDQQAVTPVKDQTQACGSCYAFSATGNIESQYAIKYKELIDLSEQQIVDCGNMLMCFGGLASISFRALINMGGAVSEADYPYTATNKNCTFDKSKVKVKLTECYRYNITSQDKVKQLLYKYGPISVDVSAHQFHGYKNGIMSDEFCGNNITNHVVLLVGYGNEDGKDYWILKNSWGENFGESGYFRTRRGQEFSSCNMMHDVLAVSIIE